MSDKRDDLKMTAAQSLQRAREMVRTIVSSESSATSAAIHIAMEIGASIIEEHIDQGADLNSVELARRFGTSRTPVREALMLLEKQGLVEIRPRRRPRVGVIDVVRAREIFQIRAVLMEFIAADIVSFASDADIERITDAAERMQRAFDGRDDRALFWANTDFHILNVEMSRNETARNIVRALLLRSMWLRRRTLAVPGRSEESIDEHWRLVRAYRSRDPQMAGLLNRLIHLGATRALNANLRARVDS